MLIRKAKISDLNEVISLLNDDSLGSDRESVSKKDKQKYMSAFSELLGSNYFDIFVMEQKGEVIGFYQIMYLPHISFKGASRAQIESVRIRSDIRGQGLGTQLIRHSIERGRKRGCAVFQLTSNKQRIKAKKFYDKLGLIASHEGYKFYY